MIIDSEKYKATLQAMYDRFMPCGEPTQYEQGFMDGLGYAIRVIKFQPEAPSVMQIAFTFGGEENEKTGSASNNRRSYE